jgi:thioredoxin-related protein
MNVLPQQVPMLKDLQQEFTQIADHKILLILLLSRSDCHFCHEVRINYLSPLVRNFSNKKLVIRELQTDVVKSLIGLDGKQISVNELLRQLKVNFFPTVVFLGANLEMLAEPLIGLNNSGFYGAYLDQRITIAMQSFRI